MIYRNPALATFAQAFKSEATAFSTTLTFNTRDEYLVWVKQWKEDYKLVLRKYQISTFTYRRDHCVLESKKLHYQKRLDGIPDITTEDTEKYNAIVGRLAIQLGLPNWMVGNSYWIIIGLLILRKAGKIRAGIKREERLATQKVAS